MELTTTLSRMPGKDLSLITSYEMPVLTDDCTEFSEDGYVSDSDDTAVSQSLSSFSVEEVPLTSSSSSPHHQKKYTLKDTPSNVTNSKILRTPLVSTTGQLLSILKPFNPSDLVVSHKKRAWKELPPPPISTTTCTSHATSEQMYSKPLGSGKPTPRARVSFGYVQIRHYDQTIGDNPAVGYGPPISLDWTYIDAPANVPLDEYEISRLQLRRRTQRQLVLSFYKRLHILQYYYGVSDAQLKAATKQADRIKRQRQRTQALLVLERIQLWYEWARWRNR